MTIVIVIVVTVAIVTVLLVSLVKEEKKKKKIYIYLLSQYFWTEQFDLFDKRCDVLRAAFCDSRDVLYIYWCYQ